jgi:hypothetical protein
MQKKTIIKINNSLKSNLTLYVNMLYYGWTLMSQGVDTLIASRDQLDLNRHKFIMESNKN